jgi:hypothetical protein
MNSTLERPTSPAEQPQRRAHRPLPRTQYLSAPQLCAYFGVSRWTWHRWEMSGFAPRRASLPGHPRWAVEAIEGFERGLRERGSHKPVSGRLRVLHTAEATEGHR